MLDQCSKISDRVRIQSELEEAGLDINFLEQQLRQKFGNSTHRIWSEIQKWRELQIDLQDSLQNQHENMKLKKEVQLLRDALKRLRDERKGILNIHKQLKGQWNSMEQRLQDIALKSRVMMTPSSSSSDEECLPHQTPRYNTQTNHNQQDIHDSELDEILIDIPTIQAGSILDVHSSGNPGLRIPDTPPPLPPNHPKLSDSGISSNSAPDSELDANDWHYPDVPGVQLERRHNSVRVRFSEATVGRRSFSSGIISDIPPGTMILPPGQNKTKCADILGIQNIPPPPLPQRPATPKAANQKKSHKKRSSSSTRDKSKDKGKSFLPRSLQSSQSKARTTSTSSGNLTATGPAPNFPSPNDSVKYNGNNKLWNKKLQPPPQQQKPPSQLGSSLDGMIHREIAKAIRDRHALFDP
ncbi:hypothetical protein CDAR_375691 [Caerostris darwini]|uniref:Uncharacterized protein n=1 Tax=Caerostris darwini TaxID=1538125 RepID=A0AAV4S5U9_9ARAC|nr:hypothetical protein CDAR_375691 [Caerostris darwini]